MDGYGFRVVNNWKIISAFAGMFFVRIDYFEKFYSKYQAENESNKEFPCGVARLLFGRERTAPKERMVYIRTQECWNQNRQEAIARKRETEDLYCKG